MLNNACLLAKIGADTADNEQHFAEISPIGRRVAADRRRLQAQGGGVRRPQLRERRRERLAPHGAGHLYGG